MNRRERRQTSKRLGIMQFQQKLPRHKKFELIRENILDGKKRETEFREQTELSINKQIEEKESQIILNSAENIAKIKNIPVIDAMEEAKKEYLGI